MIDRINADLREGSIKAAVTGRPKHYYSIYQKMIVRGREFTDIYDLVGIRVLVESERDCYATLGVIHANWQPVPGRFKDYIAMPKFNMYQSLHTTVIGPGGKPVELQIRTQAMHRTAEYGIAAHWKYKEQKKLDVADPGNVVSDEMGWLRQLLDWQREAQEPEEFLDSLRYDLGASEVYVFTPKGDVIALPNGSTPVDFAYAVHTEVGHRCIGARVNGKLVALESTLDNGDTVEVFTSKAENAGPSRDWLDVRQVTAGAQQDPAVVRQGASRGRDRRRQDRAVEGDAQGGAADPARARRRPAAHAGQRHAPGRRLRALRRDRREPRVGAVGRAEAGRAARRHRGRGRGHRRGGRSRRSSRRRSPAARPATAASSSRASATCGSSSRAAARPCPATTSSASSPAAGECRCTAAPAPTPRSLLEQADRLVEVEWAPSSDSTFVVSIQVEALDRHGLLSDVTRVLSDERVSILSANVSTNRDRVAVSKFTFEMAEAKHLGHLLRAIRNVEGVYDVYRVHASNCIAEIDPVDRSLVA